MTDNAMGLIDQGPWGSESRHLSWGPVAFGPIILWTTCLAYSVFIT